VQTVTVDLQSNRVTITPHPTRVFRLSSIPERIEEAGFDPDDMYILARGSVERTNGEARFRIDNWERTFPLDIENPPDDVHTLRLSVQFDQEPLRLTKREQQPRN
jgi:hypothetical protein